MTSKFFTLIWFLKRPSFWQHAIHLFFRKILQNHDTPFFKDRAENWAKKNCLTYVKALNKLQIFGEMNGISKSIITEGQKLARKSMIKMGGPGDLDLLFDTVRLTNATKVIETGVAYGWSSLAILHAMSLNKNGTLISVDMPYPKMGNEPYVGIVLPDKLKENWHLIREPDRSGLKKAIRLIEGSIDLCHYDSDKSWWGRAYAYPLLWGALKPGGIFISDDIQDNMYFSEFVSSMALPYAVTKFNGKYVGLIRKPYIK